MHAGTTIRKTDFYIDGKWRAPLKPHAFPVINPSTEKPCAEISLGGAADVDCAVEAARRALEPWSQTSQEERLALLSKLATIYSRRKAEMAEQISLEMGAPIKLAMEQQAAAGLGNLMAAIKALNDFSFEQPLRENAASDRILHEPIGVAALITPWNWPANQVTLKVAPALAAGCTVVLKPSELAPLSSLLFAEMVEEAGFPPGVFNLVNGDGPTVGNALSTHPDVDMVSFTGSTRAGKEVSRAAAETVKRVALELGGKGPNLLFADCDLEKAVTAGVKGVMRNSGQNCNAPTRMLVQREIYAEACRLAAALVGGQAVGASDDPGAHIGPVSSEMQYDKIQYLISTGIEEGARLLAGGVGRPEGFTQGYYVRPTLFADVTNEMTIAREEIFGPVLSIIPFDDEEEAVRIANDSPYGLTSYLQTGDPKRARRVARALRAGMVEINNARRGAGSPFGGVKQSGNGREGGVWGMMEFLEVKSVSGWVPEEE